MNATVPTLLTANGLMGGYALARITGNRPLGGVVLAVAGAFAFNEWRKNRGPVAASALTAVYLGAFGASHPLAKKLGAAPSVYAVTAGTALVSQAFGGARKRK